MKCPDCKRTRSKCRRFADELARGMRADMGGTDAVIAAECIGHRDLIRAQKLRDICAKELADANADRANYSKALEDAAVAVGCSEEWSNMHSHDGGCILDGIGGMKQGLDLALTNLARIAVELDSAAHLHNSIGEPKVAKHIRAAWTIAQMTLAQFAPPVAKKLETTND